MSLSEEERKIFEKELKEVEADGNAEIASTFESLIRDLETAAGAKLKDSTGTPLARWPGSQVYSPNARSLSGLITFWIRS